MAEYRGHPANGDDAAMAPADLSLLTAAFPSVLRERLASFRKNMLLGELDGVHKVPKLSGDRAFSPEAPMVRDVAGDKQEQVRVVEDELSRPSSSASSSPVTPEPRTPVDHGGAITKDGNNSGVAWNRVSPGFNLLQSATYEAQRPRPDNGLARSLFINGLLYLLDALPNDLSAEEASIIRSRLPNGVERTMPICTQASQDHTHVESAHGRRERSLLHRALATTIIQMFVIVHFLVPYAKLLLQYLYKYERSYRVTERVLAISIETIDSLGKGGSCIGSGDKDNGSRIQDVVAWGLEETVRGVTEGVGEGLAVLGVGPGPRDNGDPVPR